MSKYVKYPSYRDSWVEWLGEIPEDWKNHRIDWINTIIRGNTGFKKDELLDSGKYVALQYGKTYKVDKVNEAFKFYVNSEFYKFNQLVHYGDTILISTSETVEDLGHSCFYNRNDLGLIGGEQLLLKPNSKFIFDKYQYYISKVFCAELRKYATGLKVFRFNIDDLKKIFVSIPPLQEQQIIANYLDIATAKIDTLIEKQTKLIELLREKRQAVISTAVTRGLDNRVAMKDSGVEWLGKIPEHWEVKKLKYSLSLQTEKQKIEQHDVVALENIEGWSGKYIETDSNYQGDDVAFQEDDILFGKLRPYLAKVYRAKNSGIAFGDILVYRPKKDTDSGYAFYSMISEAFIDIVDGSTYGSKMPRASVEFVSNMPTAIAPKQEQKHIAKYLNETILKIETLILKSTKAIDLLKEKRTALISAAVTGKIKVNDEVRENTLGCDVRKRNE